MSVELEHTEEQQRSGPTLTHSQSVNRINEITGELERLQELDSLTAEDESYFEELRDEFFVVDEHRKKLERAAELGRVRAAAGQVGLPARQRLRIDYGSGPGRGDYDRDAIMEPDSIADCRFRNPWDLSEMRHFDRSPSEVATEYRSRALSAVEKWQGCSDNIRQAATTIIERYDDGKATLAKQCLASSSPAYFRAWCKLATNRQHSMSADEIRAVEQVRAMSLTDSAGGYLVPMQLDPTVIITSDGYRSDIRAVARVVVATGDVWYGVSSTHVSWSWDPEFTEVSDDATVWTQPSIPNYKAAGFVPISIEALEDEANVTAEVGRLLAGGKQDLEASAFITGSGTNQPTGIVTALTGGASVLPAAADDTFALVDVYAAQGALPARYRANASWLANNLIYNLVRQLDASNGSAGTGLWSQLTTDRPPTLLGRPAYEAETMDGTVTTTGTTANYVLLFGDFSNFVITDRVGMTTEFIPHLFGNSNRPTGQRGWYCYYRTGSDSVNDGAFVMLNVASAS